MEAGRHESSELSQYTQLIFTSLHYMHSEQLWAVRLPWLDLIYQTRLPLHSSVACLQPILATTLTYWPKQTYRGSTESTGSHLRPINMPHCTRQGAKTLHSQACHQTGGTPHVCTQLSTACQCSCTTYAPAPHNAHGRVVLFVPSICSRKV